MAIELTADLILGIGALGVAAVAIVMFLRATSDVSRKGKAKSSESQKTDQESLKLKIEAEEGQLKVPKIESITERTQVEKARSKIRTLTLQQEILGMVMKRLFEAEDEGEISREERERLASNYDAEMKSVSDELRKAELIVSLNELEEIRSSIIHQFQETLNDTQIKIDMIIKELDIEKPEPSVEDIKPKKKTTKRRREQRSKPVTKAEPEEEKEEPEEADLIDEEIEDEEEESPRGDSVEDRLEKLKEDVLKELEELDRLELEA
ncbi:hypothetical protein GF319_03035 [Candidatus Bathyarchaeota archaeon]|nr:hypothetical protein [Candidatus Bathyarchaeota archaeon]